MASARSWPRDDGPQGKKHLVLGHEGSTARRGTKAHVRDTREDASYWRWGPQKKELKHVWGQGGAGSQNQERNRGPVMVMPLVQGSSLGPFTSEHPFLWNPHPLPSGLAAGLGVCWARQLAIGCRLGWCHCNQTDT